MQYRPVTSAWIHRFSLLTAAATLGLIGVGGLVTSHGVGMAVPDWPNTYGYNMFFFPFSKWVGGVFYEHSHRLLASAVGLMTTILALWFYGRKARLFLRLTGALLLVFALGITFGLARHRDDALVVGLTGLAALGASFVWPRCEASPRWLRRIGVVAFLAVVLQGVLGGLRVVLFKDQIGIFHATLAQLFFVLLCAVALLTSPWWQAASTRVGTTMSRDLTWLFALTSLLVLAQLVLGATMRHEHAGLAIPDFPLAYGRLWPETDPSAVARYNQQRIEVVAMNPITSAQITLQMLHRLLALMILGAVGFSAWRARRQLGAKDPLARLGLAWIGLILIQALLGAATIWSNKAADIATLHVVTGAMSLASGGLLTLVAYRRSATLAQQVSPETTRPLGTLILPSHPAAAAGLK